MFPRRVMRKRMENAAAPKLIERAASQETPDHIQRITTIAEKSTLLGPLPLVARHFSGKFAHPDRTQLFTPIEATVAQRLLDILSGETTLSQLFTYAQGAVTRIRTHTNEAFQIACFAEKAFFGKTIQCRLDEFGWRTA